MVPRDRGGDARLVRAALASAALPNKVAYAARGLLNGFWLGVLSDSQFQALDERYYARNAMYRTDAWNERGLFGWERELIDAHFASAGRVAVVASGGGREVLALRGAGYDAIGFESHPDLARFADGFLTARGHPGCSHATARDTFPADGGPWSAVVIGWGGYSLVSGRDRRVALLRSIRSSVAVGTPVLLSIFERATDSRETRLTTALANALRRLRRRPLVDPGDTLSPNRLHMFTEAELTDEAAQAGFDLTTRHVFGEPEAGVSDVAAVLTARA